MNAKDTIKQKMNLWAEAGIPFLFMIDFEIEKPLIFKIDEINSEKLLYDINGFTNDDRITEKTPVVNLTKCPEKYESYLARFEAVKKEIAFGNSYLLNLTCTTPVCLNLGLREIFSVCKAKYRIWFEDMFVCFSPEIFVRISDGTIRSFPMKGTIDADIPDAREIILNDKKETAEHYTIVDLIRNDLNIVSDKVRVERFRYIDTIVAHDKKLLQVSSEICGHLDSDYRSHIGDIIFALLPAGSVSGAPKKKTAEIIAGIEGKPRGYYSGIAGIFDGVNLDSGVMIRFIERTSDGFVYRSGGGITSFSDLVSEYNEMIDKIYVPVA